MEGRRRVEFTTVELVGGTDLAALVEKAAADPVEKAWWVSTLCWWSASRAWGEVRCELRVGEFHPGRRELHASEFCPSHDESWAGGARDVCGRAARGRASLSCGRMGSLRPCQDEREQPWRGIILEVSFWTRWKFLAANNIIRCDLY